MIKHSSADRSSEQERTPQAKAEVKSLPKAKSLKSGQCRKASRLCCSRTKPPI
jgi:hypothetical protein